MMSHSTPPSRALKAHGRDDIPSVFGSELEHQVNNSPHESHRAPAEVPIGSTQKGARMGPVSLRRVKASYTSVASMTRGEVSSSCSASEGDSDVDTGVDADTSSTMERAICKLSWAVTDRDSGCSDGSSTTTTTTTTPASTPAGDERDEGGKGENDASLENTVHSLGSYVGGGVTAFITDIILSRRANEAFLVTDLSSVAHQVDIWRRELPMVEPFYAIKCNPKPAIVRLLGEAGVGFDCATQGEIDLVVNDLGISPERIVYANPAKMHNHLCFARDNGVTLTVFDSTSELHKLASVPDHAFRLLLRIATDDASSICRFSNKFGAHVDEVEGLLALAQELGLCVAGVSFHVGSGCGDAAAYSTALSHAADVFILADRLGLPPLSVVDIGGGFPGGLDGYGGSGMPSFRDLARVIRNGITAFSATLTQLYSRQEGTGTGSPPVHRVRFISEPGRFFVSAATTAVTQVYAHKIKTVTSDDVSATALQALYVDDGVYGTFNNIIYDHATPVPYKVPLDNQDTAAEPQPLLPTAVFGPTCDGLDQLCSAGETLLPQCRENDWLYWPDMGSYTHTASFVFNGYTHMPCDFYCA